jgi:SAM-dependent methyltransferase
MDGFGDSTYGDAFADVYDEWYADVTDVDATVALIGELVGESGRVLELGVGTGRLAIPLAAAGLDVVGIDSSAAMLERLAAADPAGAIDARLGDMVDDLPEGPFDLVLAAYNTFFNLLDGDRQRACFDAVASRLDGGGSFVVEAFVPDSAAAPGSTVSVRSIEVDRVVLAVTDHDPAHQRTTGQFVELSEAGGVRLRPWAVRWATPDQLDAMADGVGLRRAARWADMAGTPFEADSAQHVSVYTR